MQTKFIGSYGGGKKVVYINRRKSPNQKKHLERLKNKLKIAEQKENNATKELNNFRKNNNKIIEKCIELENKEDNCSTNRYNIQTDIDDFNKKFHDIIDSYDTYE